MILSYYVVKYMDSNFAGYKNIWWLTKNNIFVVVEEPVSWKTKNKIQ